MEDIVERILARNRKGFFRARPVFKRQGPVERHDLAAIEAELGVSLPDDLTSWLLCAGWGHIDEVLSFDELWLFSVEKDKLGRVVSFAQDDLGNFYAFRLSDQQIFFLDRHEPKFSLMAPSFRLFMEELERRDFQLYAWLDELPAETYENASDRNHE